MTLLLPSDPITVSPFGDEIIARTSGEKIHEEVYRSIPALSALADQSMLLGTRLSQDARNAIFFPTAGMDTGLRELSVELALKRRHDMETAQPDMTYLAGQKPEARQAYETADNDLWLKPGK